MVHDEPALEAAPHTLHDHAQGVACQKVNLQNTRTGPTILAQLDQQAL